MLTLAHDQCLVFHRMYYQSPLVVKVPVCVQFYTYVRQHELLQPSDAPVSSHFPEIKSNPALCGVAMQVLEMYEEMIRNYIAPMFKDDVVVFQKRPTFRVHLPNNVAVPSDIGGDASKPGVYQTCTHNNKNPAHATTPKRPIIRCVWCRPM